MLTYDVIIIGGGPAGLTAGIYTTRAGVKTLLIEKLIIGGQVNLTDWVENYPGFPKGIAGPVLMQSIYEQAQNFGLQIITSKVIGLLNCKNEKIVKTQEKDYKALTVIIAAGAQPQKLGVRGEDKLIGKGVSYCATCDGPLFRDKNVIVVGGGDTAIEEAIFLTKFANKVTLVHRRDKLRASKIGQEKAFANQNLNFILDSIVQEIVGEKKVEKIKIKNLRTNEEKIVNTDGIFIFTGTKPDTEFIQGIIEMDEKGYIITDENMLSSCEGVYACGDVRKKLLRQIVTACGEGATAGFAASQYIENIKGKIR